LFQRWGGSPASVANKVITLVGRSRTIQTVASGTYLLWLLKRLSSSLYGYFLRFGERRMKRRFEAGQKKL
jgi:hypothetical protein